MPQKILFRNLDYEIRRRGFHHTLAAQTRVDARIDGPVDEIFFFIGDLGQRIAAAQHVHVARRAAANAAAVVLQLDTVVEGHIQHRFALGGDVRLRRLTIGKPERNGNSVHTAKENRPRGAVAAASPVAAANPPQR